MPIFFCNRIISLAYTEILSYCRAFGVNDLNFISKKRGSRRFRETDNERKDFRDLSYSESTSRENYSDEVIVGLHFFQCPNML